MLQKHALYIQNTAHIAGSFGLLRCKVTVCNDVQIEEECHTCSVVAMHNRFYDMLLVILLTFGL